METNDTTKTILLENALFENNSEHWKQPKKKQKRVVVEAAKWDFDETELDFENIFRIIKGLHEKTCDEKDEKIQNIITRQIQTKISGYRSQDSQKKLLDLDKFVDIERVFELMAACNLDCYYCGKKVNILYEYVREPKQWTLERMDNDFGHNKDNLQIACLDCNIHRKTMYHERFLFTKQMGVIKKVE